MVTNLSHLAAGSLGVQAGSMANGNTVSTKPDMGAPGSESEQTMCLPTRGGGSDLDVEEQNPDNVGPVSDSARETVVERGGRGEYAEKWADAGGKSWAV